MSSLVRWPITQALAVAGLVAVVLLTWQARGWRRGVLAALMALGMWGAKFLAVSPGAALALGVSVALLWLIPTKSTPSCPCGQETAQSNLKQQQNGVTG